MTEPDATAPRVYGDEEIGRILKRATELQHAEPAASPAGGVTLAELEQIAAEAGIDPRYLRRAAMELNADDVEPTIWTRVTGERLVVAHEAVVSGELPEEGFERVVTTLDRSFREHGQPSLLGRTLMWRAESATKTRTTRVTVTVRGGETRIRAEEKLHQLASGLFLGSVTGIGAGVGVGVGVPVGLQILGSALFAAAAPLGIAGLTYIGCRAAYRSVVRQRGRVLADLVARVEDEVRTCVGEAGVGAGSGASAAALPPVTPP